MNCNVYKLTNIKLLFHPQAMLEWLDQNVGAIRDSSDVLYAKDVPAWGLNWRIVKLFQKLGNGSYHQAIYIEFEHITDLIHFKLVWG